MDADLLRRIFPGEGEIATHLRGIDWTNSELGAPDTWPPNLQMATAICLSSHIPMQLWWGPNRTLIYNDASNELLRLGPPSAGARSGREIVAPDLWAAIGPMVERAFEGGQPSCCEQVPIVRGSEEAFVTFSFGPIAGDDGRVAGLIGTCVDVTDSVVATRRLQMLNALVPGWPHVRLPSSTPELRNDLFLSTVAHELRNPLSALRTTLQALLLRTPSSELELMERSVRQLSHIVDNLLDASRIAHGRLELRPQRSEVANIVDRAMELATPLFDERNNQVFVRVPRVGLRLDVDPERIAQAIANVLSNASKYSDRGSRIWIEATRDQDRVRVLVKDEGAGIEPSRLAIVFETFHQPPELRPRSSGLGLGLAIARSLVEHHGGTLDVRSEGNGRGTECVLELPFVNRIAPTPAAAVAKPRRRLLLVEDNDDTARALKLGLEQLGYTVALAHDGPIALNVARAFDPDVVLMDIGLPVLDGWELANRLRELRGSGHELPVVAVTACDQESDKRRSTDAGFAEHLVKPIDLGKLEQLIESLPLRTS